MNGKSLEESIKSCKAYAERYEQCSNDVARHQCLQLTEWLEELQQKREIMATIRDKVDGVDMISKRDLLKIIGV